MALQNSQPVPQTRLCMSLAKFSYSVVPSGSTALIPWTHMSSHNDLFAILEPYEYSGQIGTSEKGYRFKVLQDPNVHENIDLCSLAFEARRALNESQNCSPPGQQPFITIIVKSPCIAIRYPAPDRQVRRFQVRFAREEDFYETLKTFACMKVPFVEAGAIPHHRQSLNSLQTGPIRCDIATPYTVPGSNISNAETQSTAQTYGSIPLQNAIQPTFATGRDSHISATPFEQLDTRTPLSASQPMSITHSPTLAARADFYTGHTLISSSAPNSRSKNMDANQSALSISTYIARPSTALDPSTFPSEIELPPKRQLPFKRKTRASGSGVGSGKLVPLKVTPIAGDPGVPNQSSGMKQAKPMAKPKKKPPSRKPRTNNNYRKKTEQATQNATQLSSGIEKSNHETYMHSETETQVPLQQAEAIQAGRRLRSGTRVQEIHTSPTHHDEITHGPSEQSTLPEITTTPSPYPSPESITDQLALAVLRSDPRFALPVLGLSGSDVSTVDFDSLPVEQQRKAMECFIVQNFEDPRFLKLVKMFEGTYQRIFVKA